MGHVVGVDVAVGRRQLFSLSLVVKSSVEVNLDIACFSQITFFRALHVFVVVRIPRLVVLRVRHFF